MKRWRKMIASGILTGLLAVVFILFLFQHKLIWMARPYAPNYKLALPDTAVELRYATSEGKQCVFYLPPSEITSGGPQRVWVLFCGNGSVALDWLDFAARDPDKRDGFLLVDYPGYGLCEGKATPAAIEESADRALTELAAYLKIAPADLETRLNTLGHSIGAAAALQFAAHHPVRRVVLAAPFTSLRDMAQRTVGWPLCWLLRHNFDNRARVSELAGRVEPPRVTIFHGSADTLIPDKMGRSLAEMFPKMIVFHEVEGANHNTIVADAEAEIYSAMNE